MTAVLHDPPTVESAPPPVPDRLLPALPAVFGGYDGPTSTADRREEAKMMADAQCSLHPLYRRRPGDCFVLLYRAQALNIPVGTAVDHIYLDTGTGKAGLSAQLMSYLLRRAGISWDVVRSSNQVVELKFFRRVNGRRRAVGKSVSWHIGEAITARIAHREHWQLWAEDCLWARCIARACRRFFPDIVLGAGYTPEELHDMAAGGDLPADDVTSLPEPVAEFIGQAQSESATADLISTDITRRAKRAKLLGYQLPSGVTLGQFLDQVRRDKAVREVAARADAALAASGTTPDPPTDPGLCLPAGDGIRPCGCPAAHVITTGNHLPTCQHHTPGTPQ